MVEINAYSKAKDGGKRLSSNFKVSSSPAATGATPSWWRPGW